MVTPVDNKAADAAGKAVADAASKAADAGKAVSDAAGKAAGVKPALVKLTRAVPAHPGGPTTASVPESEVGNYEAGGWHRAD